MAWGEDAGLQRKGERVCGCPYQYWNSEYGQVRSIRYLRTFKDTECGSLSASAFAVEVERWCAIVFSYLHIQSMRVDTG